MLLRSMVTRSSVCLRRVARGRRARQVGFGRFLANRKVTIDRLIEGWSDRTAAAVKGRHVLALHDTSEFNFRTTPKRRRGLGEIGKGSGRGLLLHAMLALDAKTGGCLGLVGAARPDQDHAPETPDRKQGIPPLDRHRRTGQGGFGGGRPGDGDR